MASIITDRNGGKRIEFFVGLKGERTRERIRLEGKPSDDTAKDFETNIEHLIGAKQNGAKRPDHHTGEWLAGLSDEMHGRIVKLFPELVESREQPEHVAGPTLGKFVDEVVALADVKETTRYTYAMSRRFLVEFFGEDKPLADIGPKQAEYFRAWLKADKKLAEATIAKRIKHGRQWFNQAVEWEHVKRNPFAKVKVGSMANEENEYFIDRETAVKVLAACPSLEWKLIFALSRYGGLRCPSEHLALTRQDVDFENGRLWVRSSKTEGDEGGAGRFLPLFPELRDLLAERFKDTTRGDEPALPSYAEKFAGHATRVNLRTHFLRVLKKAGVKPWPRLFHNLRGSRQTELCERFPLHVVCDWLGNSPTVAQNHYLQTTDAHFTAALQPAENSPRGENAAHFGAPSGDNACQTPSEDGPKTHKSPEKRALCESGSYSRRGSNLQPSAPEADALSN